MAIGTHSIRERALQALETQLCTLRRGSPPTNQPTEDPYQFTLEKEFVVRAPLTEAQLRGSASIGILESDQQINHEMQVDRNQLNVTLEIFVRVEPEVVAVTCWNDFLTDLHRCLRDDSTLGGLVTGVLIQGNSVDVESFQDRQIDGAMFIQLNYKTAEDDPRQRVPGVIPS